MTFLSFNFPLDSGKHATDTVIQSQLTESGLCFSGMPLNWKEFPRGAVLVI